jgi:hypothetical protein
MSDRLGRNHSDRETGYSVDSGGDPLRDLSSIMGLDPGRGSQSTSDDDGDDLMDALERELYGENADDGPAADAVNEEAAPVVAAPAISLEEELMDLLDGPDGTVDETEISVAAIDDSVSEALQDLEFDLDLELDDEELNFGDDVDVLDDGPDIEPLRSDAIDALFAKAQVQDEEPALAMDRGYERAMDEPDAEEASADIDDDDWASEVLTPLEDAAEEPQPIERQSATDREAATASEDPLLFDDDDFDDVHIDDLDEPVAAIEADADIGDQDEADVTEPQDALVVDDPEPQEPEMVAAEEADPFKDAFAGLADLGLPAAALSRFSSAARSTDRPEQAVQSAPQPTVVVDVDDTAEAEPVAQVELADDDHDDGLEPDERDQEEAEIPPFMINKSADPELADDNWGSAPGAIAVADLELEIEDEPVEVQDESFVIDTIDLDGQVVPTAEFDVPDLDYRSAQDTAPTDAFDDDYLDEDVMMDVATPLAVAMEPAVGEAADFRVDFEDIFTEELDKDLNARPGLSPDGEQQYFEDSRGDVDPLAQEAGQLADGSDIYADQGLTAIGDAYAETGEEPRRRKGLWVAGIVGALAFVGVAVGIGSTWFGDTAPPAAPPVIKADADPIKVKPEEPGGTVVPNQDQVVYDQVNGDGAAKAEQTALVDSTEEPVVLPPAVKSEERITQDDVDAEPGLARDVALLAPKRVRTMIVRPDGTLVAREEVDLPEEPAAAEVVVPSTREETVAAIPEAAAVVEGAVATDTITRGIETADNAPIAPEQAEQLAALADAPAAIGEPSFTPPVADAPTRVVTTETIRRPDPVAPGGQAGIPLSDIPVPVDRPANQPQTVVGNTRDLPAPAAPAPAPVTVAPAPAPAVPAPAPVQVASADGGFAVQIASLPSAAEAQQSFANLAGRFSSAIGDRSMNIQKADIPGKGTFFRVRIAANSRDDANQVCARIKSAGGSCFVTR